MLEDQNLMQVVWWFLFVCFLKASAWYSPFLCHVLSPYLLPFPPLCFVQAKGEGEDIPSAGSSPSPPPEQSNGGLPSPPFQWAGGEPWWSRSWIITVRWNVSINTPHTTLLSHCPDSANAAKTLEHTLDLEIRVVGWHWFCSLQLDTHWQSPTLSVGSRKISSARFLLSFTKMYSKWQISSFSMYDVRIKSNLFALKG